MYKDTGCTCDAATTGAPCNEIPSPKADTWQTTPESVQARTLEQCREDALQKRLLHQNLKSVLPKALRTKPRGRAVHTEGDIGDLTLQNTPTSESRAAPREPGAAQEHQQPGQACGEHDRPRHGAGVARERLEGAPAGDSHVESGLARRRGPLVQKHRVAVSRHLRARQRRFERRRCTAPEPPKLAKATRFKGQASCVTRWQHRTSVEHRLFSAIRRPLYGPPKPTNWSVDTSDPLRLLGMDTGASKRCPRPLALCTQSHAVVYKAPNRNPLRTFHGLRRPPRPRKEPPSFTRA